MLCVLRVISSTTELNLVHLIFLKTRKSRAFLKRQQKHGKYSDSKKSEQKWCKFTQKNEMFSARLQVTESFKEMCVSALQ